MSDSRVGDPLDERGSNIYSISMEVIDFEYEIKEDGEVYCEDCDEYIGKGKKALLTHQGQRHYEGDKE